MSVRPSIAVVLLCGVLGSGCNHHDRSKIAGPTDRVGSSLLISYHFEAHTVWDPYRHARLLRAVRTRLAVLEVRYLGARLQGFVHVEVWLDRDTIPWGGRQGVYFDHETPKRIVIAGGAGASEDKIPRLIHELFHAHLDVSTGRADANHAHPDWPVIDGLDLLVDSVL